jgi:hypothetical protein
MPGFAFFFTYNNEIVMLPVNPDSLEITYPGSNQTTEIIGLGEVNVLRGRKLATLSISCYFPLRPDYPWILTKNKFAPPLYYIDFFKRIQAAKKPVRLEITGTEISMDVSIESFTRTNIAQDDDIMYSLELREYRAYGAKSYTINPAPGNSDKTTTTVTDPGTRTNTTNAVTIGANVIVNGQLHLDSDGRGPGATRKAYQGKVNYIKKGKPCPYHITTPDGKPQGWVKAAAVQVKSK